MQGQNISRAFIGLGANLGDPVEQIVSARRVLFEMSEVVAGQSSNIFVSSPVGYDDQPDFVNCVLVLDVICGYRDLFARMQMLEESMGRVRDPHNQNAARCIDIDFLLFDEQTIDEEDLIIPHPRISDRLFVLLPLAELDADLALKYSNDKLNNVAKHYAGQSLFRLAL